MPEEKRDWRKNAAATLDLIADVYKSLHETTLVSYALRRTVEEGDPQFAEKFSHCYRDLEKELSASKAAMLHLLEKNAGQLRSDPFWND